MTERITKHITVSVDARLYRETRQLAAEYDTTVTALVSYLIERLPRLLIQNGLRRPADLPPSAPTQFPRPSRSIRREPSTSSLRPRNRNLPDPGIEARLNSFMMNEIMGSE